MDFENIRVKNIQSIIRYRPDMKRWTVKNRKNHFVGIQLSGSAYHDFGYQSFTISEGYVYFFNQRDGYSVEILEAGESYSVHFTTEEDIDTDSFCICVSNGDEIERLLQNTEMKRADSKCGELMSMSCLYRLLAEIAKLRDKNYFKKDVRMLAAREYMDGHFAEKTCLCDAVKLSGLTPRRFGELFKSNFDIAPNRYIVTRKIERAKELLHTEGISLGEVSELCGFSDVYYFSKSFKNEVGVSPSKWRQV